MGTLNYVFEVDGEEGTAKLTIGDDNGSEFVYTENLLSQNLFKNRDVDINCPSHDQLSVGVTPIAQGLGSLSFAHNIWSDSAFPRLLEQAETTFTASGADFNAIKDAYEAFEVEGNRQYDVAKESGHVTTGLKALILSGNARDPKTLAQVDVSYDGEIEFDGESPLTSMCEMNSSMLDRLARNN